MMHREELKTLAEQIQTAARLIQQDGRPVDTFQSSVPLNMPTHGPNILLQNVERTLSAAAVAIDAYVNSSPR
jgi:hypothetical protein